MGLLKGNFSFVRFHVDGQLPASFLNFVNNRIRSNSFKDTIKTAEEKSLGWVSLTDLLDADFTNASYSLGDYLIFSLRIDRKIIPPKLLKIKIMAEEKNYLAQSGKDRINKSLATGIKDKVRFELLGKTVPVPSFYDVCWSVSRNTVYFSSLTEKVADDFVDLFKKTFSLPLQRMLPWDKPDTKGKVDAQSTGKNISLFGREFLTWLWYKSEERGGRIKLPSGNEIEMQFLKRIVLEAGEGEYSQGVVCHGLHTDLMEGKEALRRGKQVKEAGIKIIHDKNEWDFTFKGDSFQFQSLKLPQLNYEEKDEDPSGAILERIYLIENAVKIMDQLYELFLSLRLSPQWDEKQTASIAKWLKI